MLKVKFKDIALQIIKLKNDDLKLRDRLIQNNELSDGYNKEMEVLHNENADRLNEIINKIGYPTIEKVGKEANDAAWLVIQHSIGKPAFMKKCLELLEQESKVGRANDMHLAFLSDRIAVFEGRPQLYGTQFDWDATGVLNPMPYDDIKSVNQRRKSIGLNTLEEQRVLLVERARVENETKPLDFEQRKKEMEEWKRCVGWNISDSQIQ